jgi:hypothetical protein
LLRGFAHEPGSKLARTVRMKPAQLEALAGTGLLLFSALRRGPLGILSFLGATALIVHAATQRATEGFR